MCMLMSCKLLSQVMQLVSSLCNLSILSSCSFLTVEQLSLQLQHQLSLAVFITHVVCTSGLQYIADTKSCGGMTFALHCTQRLAP